MIESLRRKRKFGERNKLLKMELQCCSGEWCNERRCREIEIHVQKSREEKILVQRLAEVAIKRSPEEEQQDRSESRRSAATRIPGKSFS